MTTPAKFQRTISEFVKKTGLAPTLVLRKLGIEAHRNALLLSPVLTGRFRGSWRVSVNRVDLSVAPPLPDDTAKAAGVSQGTPPTNTEASREASLLQAEFGDTVLISNNLPYAIRIERGHSRAQAPTGVMRNAFDKMLADFDRQVRAVQTELGL